MFADKTIVFFSAVPWDGLYARPQQISSRLAARGSRVLFIEPPWTYLSPLKRPELLVTWRNAPRVRVVRDNLAVYTPRPLLPGGNLWRLLNRQNQRSLHAQISEATRDLGWQVDLLWSHLPGAADWPVDTPILYECVDDHAAFGGIASANAVTAMENDLIIRARAVFATAHSLLARCREIRPDVQLSANGADYLHFAKAAQRQAADAVSIGFYGGIGPWLDLELVCSTARLMPDARFTLVGPLEPGAEVSGAPANVEFTGFRPYNELPSLLAQFDVVMIPFKVNALTRAVNPVKLYEYFSAGKPTLVTPLPELQRFAPLVYVVDAPEDFLEAVASALAEPPELALARQAVARGASWDARLDEIERYCGGELFA